MFKRRTDTEEATNKVNANLFVKYDFLNVFELWMKSFLVAMKNDFIANKIMHFSLSSSAQSDAF